MEVALEAGADDLQRVDDYFEVTCDPKVFEAVRKALEDAQDRHRVGRDQLHPDHHGRPRRRGRQEDAQAPRPPRRERGRPERLRQRQHPRSGDGLSAASSPLVPSIGSTDSRFPLLPGTTRMATTRFVKAERLQKLPPYLFAEIDRKKKAAIAAGRDVINLGVGDPDRPTPAADHPEPATPRREPGVPPVRPRPGGPRAAPVDRGVLQGALRPGPRPRVARSSR